MENTQAIDLTSKPFRVGPWLVTPDQHEWRAGTDIRRVQPRLMLLLRCLARSAGKTVARETLLELVWERRVLNDEVLSRSIADLRQALDDDAREPRFVQTIPKLGYRLIAEVEFLPSLDRTEAYDFSGATTPRIISGIGDTEGEAPSTEFVPVKTRSKRNIYALTAALSMLLLALTANWLRQTERVAPHAGVAPGQAIATLESLSVANLLQARPLTSAVGIEFSPRFSKDGLWLAYAVANPPEPGSQLVLRSRDGMVQRQFTNVSGAEDVCPLFVAADLVWTRQHQGRCQLLKQALVADTPHVLANCSTVRSCPDISADGTQIVYTAPAADASQGNGLAIIDLRTGDARALTSPEPSAGDDLDPRFSPQGEVSFIRGVAGTQSLWLMPLIPHANARRVALADSMIFGQSFLPDGRLLIASDALGFRALLKLAPEQAASRVNPELLGARSARYPDVAADGSVVYELASYDANLWLYRANAKPVRLTSSSRYEGYPVLSPDAKTLVYQSNQHGLEGIYSLSLTGDKAAFAERQLPLATSDRWAHPAFQNGSDTLWVTRYGAQHTEVWRYVSGALKPQPAAGFPLGAHDASDCAQGKYVWFLMGDTAPFKLMRRGQEHDSKTELIADGVLSYRVDPRGLFLVYQATKDQLWHCPAAPEMESCVQLPIQIAKGHALNWTLSDHALYFVEPPSQGARYRFSSRYDFARKENTLLEVPAPSTLSHGLAVARDESVIIVAQLDGLAIDLYWWLAPKR
jgi:DNA-binding winged helix-turn-helix (wHTH) protein/Tol biopolymer transport system component